MTAEQRHKMVLERLVEVLSGRVDVAEGANLINEDVILHMDRYTFHGFSAWQCWIHFIRSRRHLTNLEIVCDEMDVRAEDTIKAHGRWFGLVNGQRAESPRAVATYRFANGKIAEIWTTRANYEIMFGPMVRSHVGLLVVLARLGLWCKVFNRNPQTPYAAPTS